MLLDPPNFVLFHVGLSLVALVAGLVVVGGLIAGVALSRWIRLFIVTSALTSLTGFGFPFVRLLPSHMVGILSLVVLVGCIVALYGRRGQGGRGAAFAWLGTLALFLNVFVLLAQLFQKIPALAMLAPTPAAPAFGITQGLTLVGFIAIGWAAASGIRRAPSNA